MIPRVCKQMAWVVLAGLAAAGAGCIPSEPLEPGAMDQLWQVEPSQWSVADAGPLELSDRKLPYRYVIAYEPSVAWSVIQLYETAREFPTLTDTVTFRVSEQHAEAIASLMRHMADQAEKLSKSLEHADSRGSEKRWADATAELVGQVNAVVNSVNPDPAYHSNLDIDATAGWVVVPLLEILAATLSGETDVPLSQQQEVLERAGERISGVLLTIAFRLVGKPIDDEMIRQVLEIQRVEPPADAARLTRDVLLEYRRTLPDRYPPLNETASDAAGVAKHFADGMRYLAELSDQWPNVNYIAFEIRRLEGHRVFAAEFDVKPGKSVWLRDLDFFAPKIEFTGAGRVVVQRNVGEPLPGQDTDISVLFENVGDGGMVLHFDGIVYGLVRLFAFPLTDARLREVRYRSYRIADDDDDDDDADADDDDDGDDGDDDERDQKVRLIEVFLEATKGDDPRRLIRVEIASRPRLQDRPGLPPLLLGRDRTIHFEFLNAERRWHYTHESFAKPELWKED